MKLRDILIEDKIKEKILKKHNVEANEIKEVIFSNPLILKSGENRYIAIGNYHRYLTIIFEIHKNMTFIVTAYPSSETQIRLYKKKK